MSRVKAGAEASAYDRELLSFYPKLDKANFLLNCNIKHT